MTFLRTLLCIATLSICTITEGTHRVNEHKKEVLKITTYEKEAIVPLLPTLYKWGMREFAAYPYLYAPSPDELISPSDLLLVNEANGVVLIVEKEKKIVALAVGLPLNSKGLLKYFNKNVAEAATTLGWNSSQLFYVAYFLTSPEEHNDPTLVHVAFEALKQHAQQLGMTHFCHIEDITNLPHPSRENGWSIEPWGEVIQECAPMGISISTTWPTFQADGSILDTQHTLEFYSTPLGK